MATVTTSGVAPVPAGEALSPKQRADLQHMLTVAQEQSGLAFSLHLGPWEGAREGAERMHAALPDPQRSVLVAVDPTSRSLEIVTGRLARIALDDRSCGLAALSMTSSFSAGDLFGGLHDGLAVLGEHGRRGRVEHLDTP